jgi:hypothetical protein
LHVFRNKAGVIDTASQPPAQRIELPLSIADQRLNIRDAVRRFAAVEVRHFPTQTQSFLINGGPIKPVPPSISKLPPGHWPQRRRGWPQWR